MKKQAAHLQSVSTEKGMIVNAVYSDGRTLRVNLSDVAKRLHAFAPLEKLSEFATAKVTDFGWTLEWDCGVSLDSDRLIELALEQTGMTESVYFRRTLWRTQSNTRHPKKRMPGAKCILASCVQINPLKSGPMPTRPKLTNTTIGRFNASRTRCACGDGVTTIRAVQAMFEL